MLLQNNPVSPHLTHDFIYDIIIKLGATLKYIVVDKLVQETFYAKAVVEKEKVTGLFRWPMTKTSTC